MKIKSDYRYTRTFRMNFDKPVGVGSCDYTKSEFNSFIPNATKTLEEYEKITDDVNDIIIDVLGDDIEIDWRDDQEVEIHKVTDDGDEKEELIGKIDKYLSDKF